jgi:ribosomal protein S18 acetylase RimI-like enzyme
MQQTKIIPQAELLNIINKIPDGMSKVILFLGDRYTCIDEGVAILDGDELIGLATIAAEGEQHSGEPTIVGLWVNPLYRRQGYGKKLLEDAITHCVNERLFDVIRVEAIVEAVLKIIASLPSDLQKRINLNNQVIPGFSLEFMD